MAGNRGEGAEMEGGHPLVAPGGQGLKKGPWTAAEDAVLTEYVRKHGEGNWNSVQKNTGLMRCGKSCRLRWANHLRPNLKKGAFSPEEERIIIELHAKFGNKWARMASQLPGRTDNEIKNYWNTRMKRRQRANLPLYPDGVRTAGIPQQGRHQHHNPQPYSLSSSPLQPQQVSLTQKGRYGFDPSPLPFHPGSGFPLSSANALHNQSFVVYSDPNHQFLVNNLNLNFSMPFSASSSFLDRNISSHLLQSLNLPPMSSPGIFDGDLTGLSALIAGAPFDDSGNESSTNKDLPSSQYQSFAPILTPSSSSLNSNDFLIGAAPANSLEEYYDIEQPLKRRNSGLLDSLAEEAKAISPDDKKVRGSDYNGKRAIEENQYQSFLRPKSGEEIRIDNNHIYSMDEDLSSLLVNFPCSMPKPDWYHGGSTDVPTGEASSSALEGSTAGLDACNDVNAPPRPATAPSSGYDWKSRTSCWTNMPGIH